MARTNVKLNSTTVQQYLDGQHGMEAVLSRSAESAASAARADAPVESGDYQASIHVETARTDRMVKRVVADVPYAMVVEARDGVLAKALDAAGS